MNVPQNVRHFLAHYGLDLYYSKHGWRCGYEEQGYGGHPIWIEHTMREVINKVCKARGLPPLPRTTAEWAAWKLSL